MFDLESAMAQWRRELRAAGLAADVLSELEEHLREDIERQVSAGAAVPEAFAAALQRIGPPRALRDEFALVHMPGVRATLRRHMGKVAICVALGLLAAAVLNFRRPPIYESEINLVVPSATAPANSATQGGATQMAGGAMLKNFDYATAIALRIGPRRVLASEGGGESINAAAVVIARVLTVESAAGDGRIRVVARHSDPAMPPAVLREFLRVQEERRRISPDAVIFVRSSGLSLTIRFADTQPLHAPSSPQRVSDWARSSKTLGAMMGAGLAVGMVWVLAIWLTGLWGSPPLREALVLHGSKVLLCAATGLTLGLVIDLLRPALYQSEARLTVRQVIASSSEIVADAQLRDLVMERELALLRSPDFARQVAERAGPEIVLRRVGGGKEVEAAAAVIREGFSARVEPKSSAIALTYRHSDSTAVRPVLNAAISLYFEVRQALQASADQEPAAPKIPNIKVLQARASLPFAAPSSTYNRLLAIALAVGGALVGALWAFARRSVRPQFLA